MKKRIMTFLATALMTVCMAVSAPASDTGSYCVGDDGGVDTTTPSLANYNLVYGFDHNVYPGYSDSYVGLKATAILSTNTNAEAYLTSVISVDTEGSYDIVIYLTADGTRYFRYSVNDGEAVDVTVEGKGWDASQNGVTSVITVDLKAGANTLRLSACDDTSLKTPNVYGISWAPEGTAVTEDTTEAETTTAETVADDADDEDVADDADVVGEEEDGDETEATATTASNESEESSKTVVIVIVVIVVILALAVICVTLLKAKKK